MKTALSCECAAFLGMRFYLVVEGNSLLFNGLDDFLLHFGNSLDGFLVVAVLNLLVLTDTQILGNANDVDIGEVEHTTDGQLIDLIDHGLGQAQIQSHGQDVENDSLVVLLIHLRQLIAELQHLVATQALASDESFVQAHAVCGEGDIGNLHKHR